VTTLPEKKQSPKKTAPTRKAGSQAGQAEAAGSPEAVTFAGQAPLSEVAVGDAAEEAKAPRQIRESTATGNDKIEILKHEFNDAYEDRRGIICPAYLELAIANVTGSTIATVIIEVTFYDIEGQAVQVVRRETTELWANTSRGLRVETSVKAVDTIKSHAVTITRTRMADQERVQLRQHDINRNEAGEDVFSGVVKNISTVKADAAVVVTFFGANDEEMCRRVVVLRDIEPETIRQYVFTFKATDDARWGRYHIAIGEIM
jgi:hypothetical protein